MDSGLYQEKQSDTAQYDYTDRVWYDDDIMREAVNRVGAKTPYTLIPIPWYSDNCQSWATRVRAEYEKIKKERAAAAKKTRVVRPKDPNDIVGPEGFGEERWVTVSETLPYTIRFENQSIATAPAQVVTVTHPLDADLDWRRFRVGSFGWSNVLFEVPEGRSFYNRRLDLTEDLGFFVDVTAGIDIATGEAFWTIATIDPATGEQPEDPLIGFLPPNNDEGIGDGFVTCTIRPLRTATTGAVTDAEARIVFDTEEPIDTPPIFNTVDAGEPLSSVSPLAEDSEAEEFTVSWSGQDDEGGSGDYTIFVSDGAAPFEPWLQDTILLEATFAGLRGHSYRFYSTARDNAGNIEAPPAAADAQTVTPGGSAISGQKFSDLNGNGVKDAGDPGLQGWTIYLDANANGRHDPGEQSTVTDTNGEYSFGGLNAATYRIDEVAQDGWVQTYPTSSAHEVVLSEDQSIVDVDFGNLEAAGVSGAKFLDANGNGVRDVEEPGLGGWTIFLDEDGDGELDAGEQSTTTDAAGAYAFRFLMPATYTVAELLQPRWEQTHPAGGVHVVGLGPGQQATSTDFGNVKSPEIHGVKFSDVDGDGIQDPGEPGLEGWTVFLE